MAFSKFFKIKNVVPILFLFFSASCVSTESLDVSSPSDSSKNQITLLLSSPAEVSTRSDHDGFSLRYVAKLLKVNYGTNTTLIDRKEIIESSDNSENKIIFKADPGSKYYVYIFADYIPSESEKDKDGYYPDYFYNTKSEDGVVTLNNHPEGGTKISPNFFNNDNYDCFNISHLVEKKNDEVRLSEPLQRAVAKVRFIDENLDEENFGSLKFSNLSYFPSFNHQDDTRAGALPLRSSDLEHISIETASDPENKELFFFYTFSHSSKVNLPYEIKFTTYNSAGEALTKQINEIPTQKNFITNVKGSFLSLEGLSEDNPGNDTPGTDETKEGDIILDLDYNQNWNDVIIEIIAN